MDTRRMSTVNAAAVVFALFIAGAVCAETPGDIDHDGKVGLPESIHALQVTAGIAPTVPAGLQLAAYFPMHAGDKWFYASSEGGTITHSVSPDPETVNGVATIRFNYGGNYDCYTMDDTGWWQHKISESSGLTTTLEPPQQIFLNNVAAGAHFTSHGQGPAIYFGMPFSHEGEMQVSALGFEDVSVPGGTFPNCLKMSRSAFKLLKDASGATVLVRGYMAISWLAPDIGLVKETNRFFTGLMNSGALNTATGIVDMELTGAVVNGVNYGVVLPAGTGE